MWVWVSGRELVLFSRIKIVIGIVVSSIRHILGVKYLGKKSSLIKFGKTLRHDPR